jgi:tetratricopeptide (TPR) repeat protein
LKDTKKAVAYAEKIIALNPRHLNGLLTLATAIPEGAQDPELNKVIDYGKRVLDLPKPEGVADDQWKSIRDAIMIQNQSLVALMISNKKDYVACAKAYEDLIKLSPKDANAYYRMGICIYFQVTGANQVAVAANTAHIEFVNECNKDLMCDSEENKAKIAELAAKEAEMNKAFEDMRDRAIEAFAKAVAIGGAGQEVVMARTELEKLYRSKKSAAEQPLEGLDDLIAEKKKELGE